MENTFVVKLHYGDGIRRVVFPGKAESLAYSDLVGKARQLYSLPESAPLQLSYFDDEDDEITLAGDSDLKDALLAQKLHPLHVFVEVPALETSEEEEGGKLGDEASGGAAISCQLSQLGDAPINKALDDLHLQEKGGSEEIDEQHQLEDKVKVKGKGKGKEKEEEKEEEVLMDTVEGKQEEPEDEKEEGKNRGQCTCGAPPSQWGLPPGHWWKKKWQRHMRAMEENADKEGKPAEGPPMWPREHGPQHHHRHGPPHHHHGPPHHGPPGHHRGPPHSMPLHFGPPQYNHHGPPPHRYQGGPPWGGPGGPWGRFGRWGGGACEVHLDNSDSNPEGKRVHRHHHHHHHHHHGDNPCRKGGPWWAFVVGKLSVEEDRTNEGKEGEGEEDAAAVEQQQLQRGPHRHRHHRHHGPPQGGRPWWAHGGGPQEADTCRHRGPCHQRGPPWRHAWWAVDMPKKCLVGADSAPGWQSMRCGKSSGTEGERGACGGRKCCRGPPPFWRRHLGPPSAPHMRGPCGCRDKEQEGAWTCGRPRGPPWMRHLHEHHHHLGPMGGRGGPRGSPPPWVVEKWAEEEKKTGGHYSGVCQQHSGREEKQAAAAADGGKRSEGAGAGVSASAGAGASAGQERVEHPHHPRHPHHHHHPWHHHGSPPGHHHRRGGRPPWARAPDDSAADTAPAPAAAATEESAAVAAQEA